MSDVHCRGGAVTEAMTGDIHLHWPVRMHRGVSEHSPRLADEDHDLFLRPAKCPCQGCQRGGFQGLVHVRKAPHAEILVQLGPGPSVRRPLEHRLDHLLEADTLHDLFPLLRGFDRAPESVHPLHYEQHPLPQGGVFRESAVIAADRQGHILSFQKATGFQLARARMC